MDPNDPRARKRNNTGKIIFLIMSLVFSITAMVERKIDAKLIAVNILISETGLRVE